jgi:hypothetical protein
MCNAWNHASTCTCGWGGTGHAGGHGISSGISYSGLVKSLRIAEDLVANYRNVESYTTPNAKCPVCGASVYFYCSPNNGRVFFDELGPPWPKHGCTSKPRIRVIRAGSIGRRLEHVPTWIADGWSPFVCREIRSLPSNPEWCRLAGTYEAQRRDFFAISDEIPKDTLFQAKKITETDFIFSYFLVDTSVGIVERQFDATSRLPIQQESSAKRKASDGEQKTNAIARAFQLAQQKTNSHRKA